MDQSSELVAEVAQVRPWLRPVVVVPAVVVLSVIGGFFPSFSFEANMYVLLLGACLCALGLASMLPKRPGVRRLGRGALWWAVPALVLALNELVNFSFGSTDAHPTLSLLMDPVLDHYLARSAAYFGWLMAFWGLIRR